MIDYKIKRKDKNYGKKHYATLDRVVTTYRGRKGERETEKQRKLKSERGKREGTNF